MKTVNASVFIAIVICGLISTRTSLHAQPASAPLAVEGDNKPWNRGVPLATREDARKIFLEGNRLFKVPLFARAVEQYTAALVRWKHPAFYFNLAVAELNLGQELEARENLEHALQHGPEPLGAEQFKEAQKQLKEVERQLGHIRVSCATAGAEVSLDGATLFTGPGSREVWVKATAHQVAAKNPEYLSETRRVALKPGERSSVELKLITLEQAAEASRRWAVWKPWTVVAAGAAITAGAAVFHTLASRNFSSFDSEFQKQPCAQMVHACPDRMPEPPASPDLYQSLDAGRRERNIALGGYIAGGSLLAAGAVLVYMNRVRLTEQETSGGRVAISPVVSHDMVGILVNVSH